MDSAALVAIFRRHAVDTVIDIFALGLLNTRSVFEAMATIGGRYLLRHRRPDLRPCPRMARGWRWPPYATSREAPTKEEWPVSEALQSEQITITVNSEPREVTSGVTGTVTFVDGGYNIMGSPGRLLEKHMPSKAQ